MKYNLVKATDYGNELKQNEKIVDQMQRITLLWEEVVNDIKLMKSKNADLIRKIKGVERDMIEAQNILQNNTGDEHLLRKSINALLEVKTIMNELIHFPETVIMEIIAISHGEKYCFNIEEFI